MTSSVVENNTIGQDLLEAARQSAIRSLINCYRQLPASATKVYLACVDEASLVEAAGMLALSERPSIRKLAVKCDLSKATVQTALNALASAGLLQNNRPLLQLDTSSCFFRYELSENRLRLLATTPATQLVLNKPPTTPLPTESLPIESLSIESPLTPLTEPAEIPIEIPIEGSVTESITESITESVELSPETTSGLEATSLAVSVEQSTLQALVQPIITAMDKAIDAAMIPINKPPVVKVPLDRADDHQLIDYYQNGDQEAFAEIYKRYYDTVRHQISRHISEASSYDAAQQIFIELMEKLKEFRIDGAAKFTTWLYRFTELKVANARRKEKRETQLADDFDIKTFIRLTSPQQQIMPYLLTLDERQQECVYLHYYEGLTYQEIGEQLDLDEAVVRTYLQTARRHIRNFIEQQEKQEQDKQSWIYNKFFCAALEKEKDNCDNNNVGFTFCLFSARLAGRPASEQRDEIITTLGRIIINNVRNQMDQAFLLGGEKFAFILVNCPSNGARAIVQRIRTMLNNELQRPIALSCLIVEYVSITPLKSLLLSACVKFSEAETRGDITLVLSTNTINREQ